MTLAVTYLLDIWVFRQQNAENNSLFSSALWFQTFTYTNPSAVAIQIIVNPLFTLKWNHSMSNTETTIYTDNKACSRWIYPPDAETLNGPAHFFVCFPVGDARTGLLLGHGSLNEVIRQYDSSNTGELDRHAQHQQPCLASRTHRVVVWQEQPVLTGPHWSSFANRQMSVVLCLRRFAMKIENWHIRHQRPPQEHQRPPR